jgi:predicted DNA-binding mobile mystery protein A
MMEKAMRRKARQRLDQRLLALKPEDDLLPPPKGWVRAVREALGMTGVQFADRLGVSPQAADALQRSEASGTIQLNTLRRAAEVLDCRLVYALVPRTSLEDAVRQRGRRIVLADLRRAEHTMALEAQGVGDADLEQRVEDLQTALSDRDIWRDR